MILIFDEMTENCTVVDTEDEDEVYHIAGDEDEDLALCGVDISDMEWINDSDDDLAPCGTCDYLAAILNSMEV